MGHYQNFLSVILSVLLLISLGYLAKTIKLPRQNRALFKKEDAHFLDTLIIYLTMPALIFEAVVSSTPHLSFLGITLLALLLMLFLTVVAFLVGKALSLKSATLGAFILVAACGNTGYLGYTIVSSVYGKSGLVKAFFYDIFGTVVFIFTIGLYIAETYGLGEGKIKKLKEIVTFPAMIALVLALCLRNVTLPLFLLKTVSYLSKATIPLIMLSVGLSLEAKKIKNYPWLIMIVVVIKLLISPVVAYLGGLLGQMSPDMLKVAVLEASMPSGMLTLVIGLKYRLDTDFLPAAIVVTTALSLITIPAWQLVFKF